MYRDKQVAVVVPAFNEELLIERTIGSMPDFVGLGSKGRWRNRL